MPDLAEYFIGMQDATPDPGAEKKLKKRETVFECKRLEKYYSRLVLLPFTKHKKQRQNLLCIFLRYFEKQERQACFVLASFTCIISAPR